MAKKEDFIEINPYLVYSPEADESGGGGIVPAGTIEITENGEGIDVSEYAYADVAVPGLVPAGTKSITANGTGIDVSEYAYADVAVPTGATDVVEGSFTTGSTPGDIESVSIPYAGTGYPIFALVYVKGGIRNSANTAWYDLVQNSAIGAVNVIKDDMTASPTFSSDAAATNKGTVMYVAKGSNTSATSYMATGGTSKAIYTASNPTAQIPLVFKDSKTMRYLIASGSGSYGLKDGIEYGYLVGYSS